MEIVNILKRFLMNGVPKMVVKLNSKAKLEETLEIQKEADIYVAACLKMETFNAYRYRLDSTSLVNIGIYDRNERQRILKNPGILEREYRHLIPKLIENERAKVLANYVEKNNYYRTINGQPKLDDKDYIYLDIKLMEEYGFIEKYPENDLEHRTPLHLLPMDTLLAMENDGIIADIQEKHPDKSYISYVASRKIPIAEARRAHNFELLYFPKQDSNNRFYKDFLFYYEEAREYFTSAIYNHQFAARYDYYDGFIGIMILTMTIQRMISNLFKVVVERDFYDMATLRLFLESFGVPFVEIFTLQQQRMLVKNLNILLMKKQGTAVMYDILDLLGYDTFQLSKYVLVKQHKMIQENVESDYKPVFVYRSVVSEDGQPMLALDYHSMYDYYFVGVDMREQDIRLADTTAENSYDYESFTLNDPTWIEDEDLLEKLEETDFNFIETKYADISVNIRMQDKLFETIYLSRMLLDKHKDTKGIKITLSKISDNQFSLLETEVFLICLMCKNSHMVPNILRRPSQILAVLGFDFHEDIERIKEDIIKENDEWFFHHGENLYDMSVLNYLKTVTFKTAQDVNDFYVNIRDFEEFLSYGMMTTQSVDTYHAYRKLYNALMVTYIDDETYKDADGNPVFRYDDYLRELNVELYMFYQNLNDEECTDYINYIATKFATLFEDTEYMGLLDIGDATLIEGIVKILRTFKSLTLDLKNMDVVYVFDSRTRNTMRLFSKTYLTETIRPKETPLKYGDWHNFMIATMIHKDYLFQEFRKCHAELTVQKEQSLLDFRDSLCGFIKTYTFVDGIYQRYDDNIHALTDVILRPKGDSMRLTDRGRALLIWDGEEPKVIGGTPT